MISWSDRGSMVDWSWLGFGIGGSAFVLDIGNMAALTIGIRGVGDSLGATIRKGNSVRATHNIAIRVLGLGKVGTRVLIVHSILISVGLWGLVIDRGGMVWGWWADWGGRGNSGQEGSGGNHGFVHVG